MKRLCITLGDPAGIGPEVSEAAARTFLAEVSSVELLLVGPSAMADGIAGRLGPRVRAEGVGDYRGPLGAPSAASGAAALAALRRGIELIKAGSADALVTAPLSKEALALAGSADRGHTEILARELGRGPTAMAFFSPKLRAVLATTHVSLREAIAGLSTERVVECSVLLHEALRARLGIAAPRLGLAALNPHASEHGLMGDEEERLLVPALALAAARGVSLSGPWPADSVFRKALDGELDGVVALYHDQALIPIKLLSFGEAVNVTLGLSAPRTSPDHGTAYDLVGTGRARPDGMLAALRTAHELALGA